MNEKELVAVGLGLVPAWLADEGLELAVAYFENNDLDPKACFDAMEDDNNSELAGHWYKAQKLANKVLLSDSRYDNSMVCLDFDIF